MSESELDGLLGEISGPCTYDNMVKMFQEKMAGKVTSIYFILSNLFNCIFLFLNTFFQPVIQTISCLQSNPVEYNSESHTTIKFVLHNPDLFRKKGRFQR